MKPALPPLNALQQELVMQYYKLTKGRGHHLHLSPGKRKTKVAALGALKQQMLKAGIPGSFLYGD